MSFSHTEMQKCTIVQQRAKKLRDFRQEWDYWREKIVTLVFREVLLYLAIFITHLTRQCIKSVFTLIITKVEFATLRCYVANSYLWGGGLSGWSVINGAYPV